MAGDSEPAVARLAAAARTFRKLVREAAVKKTRYDDGICYYYFSHNSYDNNTHLNKSGDCSHVAIGPDGVARPVYLTPTPYGAVETYGSGLE